LEQSFETISNKIMKSRQLNPRTLLSPEGETEYQRYRQNNHLVSSKPIQKPKPRTLYPECDSEHQAISSRGFNRFHSNF